MNHLSTFSLVDMTVNSQVNPRLINEQEKIYFSWKMQSDHVGIKQASYQIELYKKTENGITAVWNSNLAYTNNSINILYEGEPLECEQKYYWKTTVRDQNDNPCISEEQFFITGCDWSDAFWITTREKMSLPVFTSNIKTDTAKELENVILYASSLGVYDIQINGTPIAEQATGQWEVLSPGWSDYHQLIHYQAYDITSLAASGELLVESYLGNGWFLGQISKNSFYENIFSDQQKKHCFIGKIVFLYKDGTKEEHCTSKETWKYFNDDTVIENDFYNGEVVDFTKQNRPGEYFDAEYPLFSEDQAAMKKRLQPSNRALVLLEAEKTIQPQSGYVYFAEEVTTHKNADLGAVAITKVDMTEPVRLIKDQILVIDFGQNCSAVFTAYMSTESGKTTTVQFHTGEMINDGKRNKESENGGSDGPRYTVYRENLSTPMGGECLSRDIVVFNDTSEIMYRPKYTYHGFRYLEIKADATLIINRIVMNPMSSITRRLGYIKTSNEHVNQLFQNTLWSQKSNYFSIPTDCPQRSERVGWLGDAQIFLPTALYNYDSFSFIQHYIDVMNNSSTDKIYSSIIPQAFVPRFSNLYASGWTDAGITIPWNLYKFTGNPYDLEKYYHRMHSYMEDIGDLDTVETNYDENIFGDWLSFQGTSTIFMNLMYRAYCADIMREISRRLGKAENERRYLQLFEKVKAHVLSEYVRDEDGKFTLLTASRDKMTKSYHDYPIVDNAQTGLTWFLKLKLYKNEAQRIKALNLLQHNIENINQSYRPGYPEKSLAVGFLGVDVLLPVLTEHGGSETAYDLLLSEEMPSWLYSVKHGATTIWERWNSYSTENSFFNARMNSFNHYSYGSVIEWMYKYMAGIRINAANEDSRFIELRPMIDRGCQYNTQSRIKEVDSSYDSIYGPIISNWRSDGQKLTHYFASIPANAEAVLYLDMGAIPHNSCQSCYGADFAGVELKDNIYYAKYILKSGSYEFLMQDHSIAVSSPR
ncbi:hypothetical protein EHV15_21155 [Paenibacillus oralis]|uniref:alpha-L-rhamnosidase n=1 Tax=Paenibacillus oralis TaxID=2490856 RepID=A0A3P3U452_9BACL|nr:family 78 glycoside hydrolase catalytic domain [Paenibacillus oralis]RRJ65142.1 hypothetical protein EHV15_21155 [Paenibacillus oralis]